jgi:hypothetical protein
VDRDQPGADAASEKVVFLETMEVPLIAVRAPVATPPRMLFFTVLRTPDGDTPVSEVHARIESYVHMGALPDALQREVRLALNRLPRIRVTGGKASDKDPG